MTTEDGPTIPKSKVTQKQPRKSMGRNSNSSAYQLFESYYPKKRARPNEPKSIKLPESTTMIEGIFPKVQQ